MKLFSTTTYRLLIALLMTAVLSGCTLGITYRLLPTIAMWSLEDYIDFEKEQRIATKGALSELIEWHRYQELPRYVELLQTLSQFIDRGDAVTLTELEGFSNQIQASWRRFMNRALPQSVDILSSLSDDQITELRENLADDIIEEREELDETSPEKTQAKRLKMLTKQAVKLMGKLSPEQEQIIKDWSVALIPSNEAYLQQSIVWNKHFAQALEQRKDKAIFLSLLTPLFVYPEELWPPHYREIIESNRSLTTEVMLQLLHSMNEKQKTKAHNRLNDLIDDLNKLSQIKP
ncbi:MAG: DUF6279 family lipoprotein [Pseudomonadales bacterium]